MDVLEPRVGIREFDSTLWDFINILYHLLKLVCISGQCAKLKIIEYGQGGFKRVDFNHTVHCIYGQRLGLGIWPRIAEVCKNKPRIMASWGRGAYVATACCFSSVFKMGNSVKSQAMWFLEPVRNFISSCKEKPFQRWNGSNMLFHFVFIYIS